MPGLTSGNYFIQNLATREFIAADPADMTGTMVKTIRENNPPPNGVSTPLYHDFHGRTNILLT